MDRRNFLKTSVPSIAVGLTNPVVSTGIKPQNPVPQEEDKNPVDVPRITLKENNSNTKNILNIECPINYHGLEINFDNARLIARNLNLEYTLPAFGRGVLEAWSEEKIRGNIEFVIIPKENTNE